MIRLLCMQTAPLTEIQKGVRDHFQEGGSVATTFLVLLGLIIFVYAVYYLTKREQGRHQPIQRANAPQLFAELLEELDLSVSQRRTLKKIAADLSLKHPTAILLSPALFDRHSTTWQTGGRPDQTPANSQANTDDLKGIRAAVFPDI